MIILTPPSEGKSSNNTVNKKFIETNYIFKDRVEKILSILDKLDEKKIVSIYGTTLDKARELHKNNLNIFDAGCSKAIERYTGVVFKNIDWDSLDLISKNYLNQNLRIVSGLFGILKPDSLIPNYKLKMNVLSLTDFWKNDISNQLKNEDFILDLLPATHRKALKLEKNILSINFIINRNGKLIQSAHSGKVVKGKFIRFLAQNKVYDFKGISEFEYDGYKWNGEFFVKDD
ncbi:MAG: hypothetical protein CL758_06980 [Chloroflexi bacterium]|nr:hypothetical protein [Chloroflexota bacterium]|tara:strand:- start:25449 stop:26141 length:693 start_codon:yes stop_codon:yes gene_type:complete